MPLLNEPNEYTHICQKASQVYGTQAQVNVAIEECGEVIQALAKFQNNRSLDVEEEIADVLIMMYQLRMIFDTSLVDRYIEMKMERLEKRLEHAPTE